MQYLKTNHYRDKNLLNMARGKQCLFRVPGVCFGDPSTVVAAHSNRAAHGKSMAKKAQDHYSAWACVSCHNWYDQGNASREDKHEAFETAHRRQVIAWDAISESDNESTKDRHSATQALIELDRDASFNG